MYTDVKGVHGFSAFLSPANTWTLRLRSIETTAVGQNAEQQKALVSGFGV